MENRKQELFRFTVLGVVVGAIFFIFFYQLVMIQIAQGEYYKDKATAGAVTKQMVPAVRGEIVDRYGRPFTTNRVGYNVILDRTYLPYGKENDVLLSLMEIMERLGQSWIDNLPISETAPFVFKEGMETQVARLKKALEISEYATAEDCMSWLAGEEYYRIGIYDPATKKRVENYDPVTTRKLAGVRYEMAQSAFSLENTYTFASDVGAVARDTILERTYMLPGVDVIETPVREYVEGTLAPHVLGITGPIYKEEMDSLKASGQWATAENPSGYRGNEFIGKSGIEYSFESILRGKSGERLISLDNKGNVEGVEETVPPTPGSTVVLTLDKDLQRATQNALETVIKGYNASPTLRHDQGKDSNAGAAVALDPKTGEVLAIATYPGYDINTYLKDFSELSKMKPEPLLNRATMGIYRPGSTYKPTVATAGLAEGVVGMHETINCTFIYTRFADYQPRCMHFDGPITAEQALQRSCNIFFYETGWRLGIDKQNEYSAHFGLGSKTGIEIQEATGRRSSPATREAANDNWGNGYVIQSAIGQLDHGFTPVQLAAYVGTLANNGSRMNTHLVKSVKSYDFKDTINETEVKEIDHVPGSQEVFDTVRRGMVAATGAGGTSGWLWTGFPLTVASKTGTPEASGDVLDSTYICYIPAEDPQIAIAVVIENGGQGYTGAPVARLIAEEFFFGGAQSEKVQPAGELLP